MKLALWYHVADLPGWQKQVEQSIEDMENSGLWNAIDLIHFQCHYAPESFEKWIQLNGLLTNRVHYTVYQHSQAPRGECWSMHDLGTWCRVTQLHDEDWMILRYHNKGITKLGTPAESTAREWARYYQYWTVEQWRLCVAALEAGYVTVGANWHANPGAQAQGHWSGNIWWARSDYLARLPQVSLGEQSQWGGYSARHDAELWVGMHDDCERRLELHHYEHGCVYNVDAPRGYQLDRIKP